MSKDPAEKHKAWKREHRDKPAHVKSAPHARASTSHTTTQTRTKTSQ